MTFFSTAVEIQKTDFLDHPISAAYLSVKEYDSYYKRLKTNQKRRDFHETFLAALENFIAITEEKSNQNFFDSVLVIDACTNSNNVSPLLEAQKKHMVGTALLQKSGLQEPITYDTLKQAYRRAARTSHPDLGGDHEAMIAVNSAFGYIHHLICGFNQNERLANTINVGVPIKNCADYRYYFMKRMFRITLDDWNLDASVSWLDRIISTNWNDSRYGRNEDQLLDLAQPIGLLERVIYFS